MKTCSIDGCNKEIKDEYEVCYAHSNAAMVEESKGKTVTKYVSSPKASTSAYTPKSQESLVVKAFTADSPDELAIAIDFFRLELKHKTNNKSKIRFTQHMIQQAYVLGDGIIVRPQHICYVSYDEVEE